jgi:hypothetical protein
LQLVCQYVETPSSSTVASTQDYYLTPVTTLDYYDYDLYGTPTTAASSSVVVEYSTDVGTSEYSPTPDAPYVPAEEYEEVEEYEEASPAEYAEEDDEEELFPYGSLLNPDNCPNCEYNTDGNTCTQAVINTPPETGVSCTGECGPCGTSGIEAESACGIGHYVTVVVNGVLSNVCAA